MSLPFLQARLRGQQGILHSAANGHHALVQDHLLVNPASVNDRDRWLVYAIALSFSFLIFLLHPTSLFRSDGFTVLHRSIHHLEVVRLLVGAGADVNAHTK